MTENDGDEWGKTGNTCVAASFLVLNYLENVRLWRSVVQKLNILKSKFLNDQLLYDFLALLLQLKIGNSGIYSKFTFSKYVCFWIQQ